MAGFAGAHESGGGATRLGKFETLSLCWNKNATLAAAFSIRFRMKPGGGQDCLPRKILAAVVVAAACGINVREVHRTEGGFRNVFLVLAALAAGMLAASLFFPARPVAKPVTA